MAINLQERLREVNKKFFPPTITPEQRRAQAPLVREARRDVRREALKPTDRTSGQGSGNRDKSSGITTIEEPVYKAVSSPGIIDDKAYSYSESKSAPGGLSQAEEAEKNRLEQERMSAVGALEREQQRLAEQRRLLSEAGMREYAPRFEEQAEMEARAENLARIEAAKRGTIRGSIEQGREKDRRILEGERKRALERERGLRIESQIRAAEGASAEEMANLKSRLNIAKEDVAKFNLQMLSETRAAGKEAGGRQFELEKIMLQEELRGIQTPTERRTNLIEYVKSGAFDNASPQQIAEAELEYKIPPGHLAPMINKAKTDPTGENFVFDGPKIDQLGNIVTPGYVFDKKRGTLSSLNIDGTENVIFSGGKAKEALRTFQNFNEYVAKTGTGEIVKGSPSHKSFEIDIDGKIGDPIQAFTGGLVKEVKTGCVVGNKNCNAGWGNTVVISSNGIDVRYAHLNNVDVRSGQKVGAGSFIGNMGNTGAAIPMAADGSHLHIEARNAQGDLVNLGAIKSFTTLQGPGNTSEEIQAEAFTKGYVTPNEVKGYTNAVKNGFNPPDKISGLTLKDKRDLERTLRKDFTDETENIQKALGQVSLINQSYKQALERNKKGESINAVSQGVLVTFQKILDPTSVVRETEYARSPDGAALLERLQGKYDQLAQGGAGLTVEGLTEFVDLSNEFAKGYNSSLRDIAGRTKYVIDTDGLDERAVFTPETLKILKEGKTSENVLGQYGIEIKKPKNRLNDIFQKYNLSQ